MGRCSAEGGGGAPQSSSASLGFCCVCCGEGLFVCCWEYCTVLWSRRSVAHLLGDLVRVQDARHRHLDLVLLLLGLPQRRLPLLQEQVRGVLARKLLQRREERQEVVSALKIDYTSNDPFVIPTHPSAKHLQHIPMSNSFDN